MKRAQTTMILALLVVTAAATAIAEQSFAVEPEDLTAVLDSTVSLPCRVANRAGELQWTKDDFALGVNRNLSYYGYTRYSMTGNDSNGKSSRVI